MTNTIDHMSLIDIYRIFHPMAIAYTFIFQQMGNTLEYFKIDMTDHKTSLNQSQILPYIFSNFGGMKLENNNIRNSRKSTSTSILNNIFKMSRWSYKS